MFVESRERAKKNEDTRLRHTGEEEGGAAGRGREDRTKDLLTPHP